MNCRVSDRSLLYGYREGISYRTLLLRLGIHEIPGDSPLRPEPPFYQSMELAGTLWV